MTEPNSHEDSRTDTREPDEDLGAGPKTEAASVTRRRRAGRRSPGQIVRHPAFPWILALVFLASAVAFALLWLGARGGAEGEDEVLTTSRRFLEALTTFSAGTIDDDVERIRSFAVGRFADEVDEQFGQERIAALKDNKAVSTGRVESVFIQQLEGSTATVFGVLTQTFENEALPAPRVEVLRVEVQLIETQDGWKVSSVSLFQTPALGP